MGKAFASRLLAIGWEVNRLPFLLWSCAELLSAEVDGEAWLSFCGLLCGWMQMCGTGASVYWIGMGGVAFLVEGRVLRGINGMQGRGR